MRHGSKTVMYSKDGAYGDTITTTFNKQEWFKYCSKLFSTTLAGASLHLPSRDVVLLAVASKWRKAAEDRLKNVDLGPLAGNLTCKTHNVAITKRSSCRRHLW